VSTKACHRRRASRCSGPCLEPAASLLPQFDTEDEAVKLANNTEYGLAAYYYTTVSLSHTLKAC
jgi:hypothetical protein